MLANPFEAWLTLSYRCNLSCSFCYERNHRKNPPKELTVSEWLDFIDELATLKVLNVHLLGGEPFVLPYLKILLERFAEKNIRYFIISNGTLIDENWCKFLANSHRCSGVQISLDGFEGYHDSIRGKGTFQKAVSAINNLANHGIVVTINSVITKENWADCVEFGKFLESLPIKNYRFNPRNDAPAGEGDRCCGRLSCEELVNLAVMLDSEKTKLKKLHKRSYPISLLKELKNPAQTPKDGCSSMYIRVGVRPDGGVQMCPGMFDPIAGYIGKKPLIDIWQSSTFENMRQLSATPVEHKKAECIDCQYKITCSKFCLAMDSEFYCHKKMANILKDKGVII